MDSSAQSLELTSIDAGQNGHYQENVVEEQEDDFEDSPTNALASLEPPASKLELFRDGLFDILDGRFFFYITVIVLILVVVDGALFFFLLVGFHRMCRPRWDCEPRNWWFNFSIQVLNVLFTYLVSIALPWNVANALHLLGCSGRPSDKGLDLYGMPSEKIWFHTRQRKRGQIVLLLIGNCISQYVNQATRIVYYSYELSDQFPANILTTMFFFSAMVLGTVGGCWQMYEENLARKAEPERFPPGPLELAATHSQAIGLCKKKNANAEGGDNENMDEGLE